MSDHTFCRVLETVSRRDCKLHGSDFSVCSSSLGPIDRQHFVEGPDQFSVCVTACCRWHARAVAYQKYLERPAQEAQS